MYIKTLQFYPNVIKSYARFFFMASSFSRSCLASRVRVGFVALFVFFLCLDLSENARTYAQEEQYNREAQESGVHLPHMMGTMRHRRDRYQKQKQTPPMDQRYQQPPAASDAQHQHRHRRKMPPPVEGKLGRRCLWCKAEQQKEGKEEEEHTSEAKTTTPVGEKRGGGSAGSG